MAVDTHQLDAGQVQRHRQPPSADAEVEHGRGGPLRELQPGRKVGGVRKLRVEFREPFIGDRWIVANDAHARARARSLGDGPVRDVERLVDDLESLRQFLLVDAQRWVRHDRVPADEGVEALLAQRLRDRLHRLRGSVEGSERLHGFTVFHQLEDAEETDRPREADRWMLPPELLVVALHHLAHPARIAYHVVLFVRLDRTQGRRAGERVTVVGQPAIEDVLLEVIRDLRAHPDRAERDVAARQPLRHGDDVGDHLPMVDGEPLARPTEPGHNLVADHQDAVAVAQLPDALQVSIWWDQDPVRPGDRLQDEAGDGAGPLELDGLLQVAQ